MMLVPANTILFKAVGLCFLSWIDIVIGAGNQRFESSKVPGFDWSALAPSSDLIWHECYSPSSAQDSTQHALSPPSRELSCALLSLPLDYHNATNPHNVTLPVLKATSPPSPSHHGIIFTAFGGAGNSRIEEFVAMFLSSDFLALFDQELEYDFLTFDNRGFGYTHPNANCFDNVLNGALWEERMADLGRVMNTGGGDEGLQYRLAAARAKGELCATQSKGDDIRRHMTSAYAARDILEILKRLGDHSSQSSDSSAILKLKFLGLSYGTVVGLSFASLYPQYVSRMILDGAVDPSDWTAKWQLQHLIDTDAVWATFYQNCFAAKEACPLWRAPDGGAANIENRVSIFIESLQERPVYIVGDGNARLATYRDVRLAIYWATMVPVVVFPSMATILDDLIKSRTNVTIDFPFQSFPTASDCQEDQDKPASSNADAGTALNCGDGEEIMNSTIEDFKDYLSALEDQSSVAAFFQGERRIRCMGWPIRPAWRFTGPFTSKTKNGSSKSSTPILFMGNKLDPMTSLRNSHEVAKNFPGSVILEQNGRGHCALGTISSPCTLGYLRTYFRDGTLPEPGTVCGEDCNPFDGSCFDGGESPAAGLALGRIWRH
jgi:pimeloyl-ACP methyl ester carboxylesterase